MAALSPNASRRVLLLRPTHGKSFARMSKTPSRDITLTVQSRVPFDCTCHSCSQVVENRHSECNPKTHSEPQRCFAGSNSRIARLIQIALRFRFAAKGANLLKRWPRLFLKWGSRKAQACS